MERQECTVASSTSHRFRSGMICSNCENVFTNSVTKDVTLVPASSTTIPHANMPSDLGTPVNTALFIYILYSVQRIVFPSVTKRPLLPSSEVVSTRTGIPHEFKAGYTWMPKSHPPTVLFKVYTPKSLEPFNGNEKDGRILLAINRIVFDVTSGGNFYGPSWFSSVNGH